MSIFVIYLSILTLTIYTQAAIAETTPTPGIVQDQIDSRPPAIKKSAVRLTQPATPTQKNTSEQRIRVKRIKFQGQTVYTNKELNLLIQKHLKDELTLNEIYNLAHLVTRFYRQNGYILASVSLPAQKIENETIVFQVIEGKIEDINFSGNKRYSNQFLELQVQSLTNQSLLGTIIKSDELESVLIHLSDLPGISARASITPGNTFGTSDVNIQTNEKAINSNLQVNNYGRDSLGNYQLVANVDINNPFHTGDLIRFSGAQSSGNRLNYINGLYSTLVDPNGSRAGLSISHFNYDVDTRQLDIIKNSAINATLSGNGDTYRLFYSYPWHRSLSDMRTFELALRRNKTSQDGSLALTDAKDDIIDLVEISLYGQKDHTNSTTAYQTRLTTNFDQASKANPESAQWANVRLDLSHKQLIAPQWIIGGRSILSYSPDDLTDTERFRVGGHDTVRAYPAAEIAGDYGVFVTGNIARNFAIQSSTIITPSLFVEAARVYQHTPAVGEQKHTQIFGAGAGITINTGQSISFKIDYAYPMGSLKASDGNDGRIWAALNAQF